MNVSEGEGGARQRQAHHAHLKRDNQTGYTGLKSKERERKSQGELKREQVSRR